MKALSRAASAVVLALLAAGSAAAAAEGGDAVTPELVVAFQTGDLNAYFSAANVSPEWMPDSRRLVFSRPDPATPGRFWIESFDTETGRTTRLEEGSDPRPSPDGKAIAFMRGKGAERQIWLMSADGKDLRPLTHYAGGLGGWAFNVAWSPDAKRIAFSYAPDIAATKARKEQTGVKDGKPEEPKSSVVVYGSQADLPLDSEIWTVEVANGVEKKIGSYQTMLFELSWFPDSKRLLVYGFRHGTSYRESKDESDVIVIDAATGARKNLVSAGGEGLVGRVSPTAAGSRSSTTPTTCAIPTCTPSRSCPPTAEPCGA